MSHPPPAQTIRAILASVKSAIGAIVPATDPTDTFLVFGPVPAGETSDVPASAAHRSVRLIRRSSVPQSDVAGSTVVWHVTLEMEVIHHWRRLNADEHERRRAEDVHSLIETMSFRRPGSANGLRRWSVEGEALSIDNIRSITTLTFSGRIGIPATVTPA